MKNFIFLTALLVFVSASSAYGQIEAGVSAAVGGTRPSAPADYDTEGKAFGFRGSWAPWEAHQYLAIEAQGYLIGTTRLFHGDWFFGGGIGPSITADAGPLYGSLFVGIGGVSKTNRYNTGNFQIPTRVTLGLRNEDLRFGIFWLHFSNGGSSTLNYGRDYYGVEVTLLKWQ